MKPRVGLISFLNCLPLAYGLRQNQASGSIRIVTGTPAELNRRLTAGGLDISPISSVEYARHHKDLLLLPGLTISSPDEVFSILLISKVEIGALGKGRQVALPDTSATSHALLQIILHEYGLKPRYYTCRPHLEAMLEEADAALLIGDDALKARFQVPPGAFVYDLGQEWFRLTSAKMVYAVWAVRRSYYQRNPDLVRAVMNLLHKGLETGLSEKKSAIEYFGVPVPLTRDFVMGYLKKLDYGFDWSHHRGLKEFFTRAHALGLIKKVPALRFIAHKVQTRTRVTAEKGSEGMQTGS